MNPVATRDRENATVRDSSTTTLDRRDALITLLVAVLLGGGLRFYRLGVEEMNRGEAAAWTAAAGPNLHAVFAASKVLDPGKSGIYDLVLHLWISLVGEGVGPMRSLSAILGTLMIALVFFATREVLRALDGRDEATAETAGSLAALFYACNLRMITTDRTARMYTLMLVGILAQAFFFARTCRRAGFGKIVATTFFTLWAVASNVLALLFFAAEATWLGAVWRSSPARRAGTAVSLARPAAALAFAALLFTPIGITDTRIAIGALHAGLWSSIEPRSIFWPLRAIRVMTGNAAFWPMSMLVLSAIWRQDLRERLDIWFLLCWLLVPFTLIALASYTVTPMMVERYVFPSLIAFLALAAAGLARLRNASLRYAITILVVMQSLAHVRHHWRAPEDVQWREAAQFALGATPAGQEIAVIPAEPVMVVRYYLPGAARDRAVAADAPADPQLRVKILRCAAEPLLIASTELPRGSLPSIAACYPYVLRHFRLVDVRGR